MEKALEELRQKSLSMVAENLEYFNCCKKEFAVSECKLWINKIFDRVNEELEEAMKPKTCHWCKQSWEPNNQTFHRYFCNYLQIPVHGNFYCNRYEAKDTQ